MRYRSRIDIIGQILEAANGGDITKSRIMYKANLNYNQLNEHLTFLTQNSSLSYDFDARTFKTTEKGRKFLDAYNQMDDMIKAVPQDREKVWM
jgi:predicted transcriptional regulator